MSYEIYFDESNKLDKFNSLFSYYGVIGCDHSKIRLLEDYKRDILNFNSEFHFVDFELKHLDYYINMFKYSLDFIESNIYIVNNDDALNLSDKLNISPEKSRNLFYMKIPERLIYGVLRKFDEFKDIDIYIDQWNGYGNQNSEFFSEQNKDKLKRILSNKNISSDKKFSEICNLVNKNYNSPQLPKNLKQQLNAQALYRNLTYKVQKCVQANSIDFVGLQIIDILLGIFSFLFEEKYLEMPLEITSTIFEHTIKNPSLNEDEIKLLTNSYSKNNDKYKTNLHQSDILIRKKLKELNKKIHLYDVNNIAKSEFVYALLSDNEVLKKILDLNIFIWSLSEENSLNSSLGKTYISKYISLFLNFKHEFDTKNLNSILDFHNDSINTVKFNFSQYRAKLNFPARLSKLVERYLSSLNINCVDNK